MCSDRWNRTAELFEKALEHPAEKRSAFLDAACRDDPELRRELETLLESDLMAADFLEKPPIRP